MGLCSKKKMPVEKHLCCALCCAMLHVVIHNISENKQDTHINLEEKPVINFYFHQILLGKVCSFYNNIKSMEVGQKALVQQSDAGCSKKKKDNCFQYMLRTYRFDNCTCSWVETRHQGCYLQCYSRF